MVCRGQALRISHTERSLRGWAQGRDAWLTRSSRKAVVDCGEPTGLDLIDQIDGRDSQETVNALPLTGEIPCAWTHLQLVVTCYPDHLKLVLTLITVMITGSKFRTSFCTRRGEA